MDVIKAVLAAIDFSEDAMHAALRAALIAAEQRAKLELLHVMSGRSLSSLRELFRTSDAEEDLMNDARRMLSELAAAVGEKAGVTATSRVTVGNVPEELLSASEQADMLVLGAHGWNPLRDRILGTTAERLLRKCRRPVLVIKTPPQGVYRRVLVPVDFSVHSAAALGKAMLVAPDADIKVIHAVRVPFEEKLAVAGVAAEEIQKIRRQAQLQAVQDIETLTKEVSGGQHRIAHTVDHGKAASLILAGAAGFNADLIVISKHGRSAVEELLLGSVTRHVLSSAKCDVLVVQGELSAAYEA